MAIEIEMPGTHGASSKAFKILEAYLASALKKRAVEISEKRMTPEEKQKFDAAKNAEVNNFLAAKAFEALPPHYKARREDAVRMRWILT